MRKERKELGTINIRRARGGSLKVGLEKRPWLKGRFPQEREA